MGFAFLSLYLVLFDKCLFLPGKALVHNRPRTLCVYGFPGDRVNAHDLQMALTNVFVVQIRSASGTLSLNKLSVQKILRGPAIFHCDYMPEPA